MAEQVDWFGPILRDKLAKEREYRYGYNKKTQQKSKKHKNKKKNKKRKIKGICPCFAKGKCPHCTKCQDHKQAFDEQQKSKNPTLGELCVALTFNP